MISTLWNIRHWENQAYLSIRRYISSSKSYENFWKMHTKFNKSKIKSLWSNIRLNSPSRCKIKTWWGASQSVLDWSCYRIHFSVCAQMGWQTRNSMFLLCHPYQSSCIQFQGKIGAWHQDGEINTQRKVTAGSARTRHLFPRSKPTNLQVQPANRIISSKF